MAERSPRKLAVILHADVVGSTTLVQQNETLTHDRIQDAFTRFAATIKAYGGRTHELRGDALVAEFDRASDAVCSALAFQAKNAAFNATLDEDIRPELRIGISMGEVVIADGTVTGAGVVLAQRLEQLADPGGVCVQGAAYETVLQRLPFDFQSLGEQELKGFEEPVRAYAVTLKPGGVIPSPEPRSATREAKPAWRLIGGAVVAVLILVGVGLAWWQPWVPREEPASVERMAFPLPDKPSIAVLPFTNMSGDAEQEYFVDGMTEDLITDLSQLSGLFVIARNSVFAYKDKVVKVKQVAEELGVRYVMEGSVRRVGNQVRINAQLIDATTGGHLWAKRYDGSMENVFALQDQVTEKIVAALAINLTAMERTGRGSTETEDPEVYETFLRGWVLYRQYTSDSFAAAIPQFEKVLTRDPTYGRAYAALADIYFQGWGRGWADKFGMPGMYQSWDRADEYMEKALKYPTALAHSVAARMLAKKAAEFIGEEGALDKGLVEAKRAIELDPNNPVGYLALGKVLTELGRPAEAIQQIKAAMRLDPRQPTLYLSGLGYAQFMDEQYDAAAESLEALTKHPSVAPWNWLILGATYGQQDRMQAAQFALEKANALRFELGWHDYNISDHVKYWTFGNRSDRDRVVAALRKIGVPDRK